MIDISRLTLEEKWALKQKYADDWDFEGLYEIVKHDFIHGSLATIEFDLPELAFLGGRVDRVEDFLSTFQKQRMFLFGLPEETFQMAQMMLNIGVNYPYLSEKELDYLEEIASSPSTCEICKYILADKERLPRHINVFDLKTLNNKKDNPDSAFLLKAYSYSLQNEDLDQDEDSLFVYDRTNDVFIRRKYNNLVYGEFIVDCSTRSQHLHSMLKDKFGSDFAEFSAKELTKQMGRFVDDDWKRMMDEYFISVSTEQIESIINHYYNDEHTRDLVRSEVALLWLNRINEVEY